MGLFLYYSGLKSLLSYLHRVVVFPTKSFMGNMFLDVFLNFRKSHSEPLLNIVGLRTSVKYHEFQNFRKMTCRLK